MKKEDMAAAMGGITTRQRSTPKNVNISKDSKAGKRKVISVAYVDYKKIKNYANDHDMSITAAVSLIIKNSTIITEAAEKRRRGIKE